MTSKIYYHFFQRIDSQESDILENIKIENYIRLKMINFITIELSVLQFLFNLNISLYIDENSSDTF